MLAMSLASVYKAWAGPEPGQGWSQEQRRSFECWCACILLGRCVHVPTIAFSSSNVCSSKTCHIGTNPALLQNWSSRRAAQLRQKFLQQRNSVEWISSFGYAELLLNVNTRGLSSARALPRPGRRKRAGTKKTRANLLKGQRHGPPRAVQRQRGGGLYHCYHYYHYYYIITLAVIFATILITSITPPDIIGAAAYFGFGQFGPMQEAKAKAKTASALCNTQRCLRSHV